jgi:hypothetical protein
MRITKAMFHLPIFHPMDREYLPLRKWSFVCAYEQSQLSKIATIAEIPILIVARSSLTALIDGYVQKD